MDILSSNAARFPGKVNALRLFALVSYKCRGKFLHLSLLIQMLCGECIDEGRLYEQRSYHANSPGHFADGRRSAADCTLATITRIGKKSTCYVGRRWKRCCGYFCAVEWR